MITHSLLTLKLLRVVALHVYRTVCGPLPSLERFKADMLAEGGELNYSRSLLHMGSGRQPLVSLSYSEIEEGVLTLEDHFSYSRTSGLSLTSRFVTLGNQRISRIRRATSC